MTPRLKAYITIVVILFLFFAPAPKNKPSLQAFVSSADACPFKCVRCTSWDPDAWPRTCLAYECDAECEAGDPGGGGGNQPPSISHSLTCTQNGLNSWRIGSLSLNLTASDPQGQSIIISGGVNGTPFACPSGQTTCAIPLPEGSGLASYKVDSATGLSASGSAFFYLDTTTPQISGSANGSSGTNGWYTTQTLVNALPPMLYPASLRLK
ncbi:MAG: hypothetical protein HXY38_11180 [Chloroflexi bacterium]|nr:hypothetical protein [Chloroflexota bacterium]